MQRDGLVDNRFQRLGTDLGVIDRLVFLLVHFANDRSAHSTSSLPLGRMPCIDAWQQCCGSGVQLARKLSAVQPSSVHSRSGVDEGLFVHMRVRARDIEQRQPCVRVLVDGVGRGTERLCTRRWIRYMLSPRIMYKPRTTCSTPEVCTNARSKALRSSLAQQCPSKRDLSCRGGGDR